MILEDDRIRWTWKDWEGSGRDLFEGTSPSEETEEQKNKFLVICAQTGIRNGDMRSVNQTHVRTDVLPEESCFIPICRCKVWVTWFRPIAKQATNQSTQWNRLIPVMLMRFEPCTSGRQFGSFSTANNKACPWSGTWIISLRPVLIFYCLLLGIPGGQ